MATLSLKISVVNSCVVKTMQFEPSMIVYDVCRIILDKISDNVARSPQEYGLFFFDNDQKNGVWLESGRNLEFYLLRNGDTLEYKKKHRMVKIRMLDETVKTIQVDDSQPVSQLMITICSKIGIANHDEYSLVRDLPEAEKEKTLTLRRGGDKSRDKKKMDEMKKKLHTDDDLDWLDHSKSLREQGIDQAEILLFKRKYFFSDQNIDVRDPVQLNLLYVQTRDAILKGAHPINQEEATVFAGIQCQIQFGDHNESKHRSGFLELKEFLPKEYMKIKGIEKKVFVEHKKVYGISEVEAKAKYTQLARSLKTYGITFFLVKEKITGKNKLSPRLLGITKDCVLRVDEKTKEIMDEFPLTTVKRWAATPNTFTFDFGDYAKKFYCVQTVEGEQISQLIGGYIDIIMRMKSGKDHFGIDGNDESTMYEDSVMPAKATIVQHQSTKIGFGNTGSVALPAILRAGDTGGQAHFSANAMQNAQSLKVSQLSHQGHMLPSGMNAQVRGLGQAQRALMGTMSDGLGFINDVKSGFSTERGADLPPLGYDPASQKWMERERDISKQKIGSQLSAINAATAQMVGLTGDEPDYAAVGSAVQVICSNLGDFSKDVQMLAALEKTESDGSKLLGAARKLTDALADLMKQTDLSNVNNDENGQEIAVPLSPKKIHIAANRVGEASREIMQHVEPETQQDLQYKNDLVTLANAAVAVTAELVRKARIISSRCTNQDDCSAVVLTTSRCGAAVQQLQTSARLLAPTIDSLECLEQLVEAVKYVAKTADDMKTTVECVCPDEDAVQDLIESHGDLSSALEAIIGHAKKRVGATEELEQVDIILAASDRLIGSVDDPQEVIRQARLLAQVTSQLVSALKEEAKAQPDPERRNKLMEAAKMLADSTAHMIEAAKGCTNAPQDEELKQSLRAATEELRSATSAAAGSVMKNQILSNLQQSAKRAASTATQLINMSGLAGKSNTNQATQNQLSSQCKPIGDDVIPRVVQALRATMKFPDVPNSLLQLINAAQDMIQPCTKLLTSAKAAIPTVSDQFSSLGLSNAAKNMSYALSDLLASIGRAQDTCGSSEIDGALDQLRALQGELSEIRKTAIDGNLVPLPGETAESAAAQLGICNKAVSAATAQLLIAVSQGNDECAGTAAREIGNVLRNLADAVRGVAATNPDRVRQAEVIDHAIDLVGKSAQLMEEVRTMPNNHDSADNNKRLQEAARAVSQALNSCMSCIPGLRDIDQATKHVATLAVKLSQQKKFPVTERGFQEVQIHLNSSAADLNQVAKDILTAASQNAPHLLAPASNRFSKAYEDFVAGGIEMAGVTKDPEAQARIVSELRGVSMASSKFLLATKSIVTDPSAPNAKNLLAQAARAVTESINQLINHCTVSAPGQKECDSAYRQMQMMRPLLDNPNESVIDGTYFDCLDTVIEKSKNLAESMTGITVSAKQGELNNFCDAVNSFANAVCSMTESAAQAAYLVGLADPASEPGRKGVIDQLQISRANQMIQSACQTLSNPASTSQEILTTVAAIAHNTSALCNACRDASSKTPNPVAKKQFIQSAKDLASSTANIVKAIKASGGKITDECRVGAIQPLLQSLEVLTDFASSPEFASTPAKLSNQARKAQEPIMSAGKAIIDGASNMIQAAKQFAINPKDPQTYQAYSADSHSVSEGIKKIVTAIRATAPGFKECDDAVEQINTYIGDLDQASLAAISQSLSPLKDGSLKSFQEQVISSARQLVEHVDPIRSAAKGEAENLGHVVSSAVSYLEPLRSGAIGSASKTMNSKLQMQLLDQSKTVIESMQNLIFAAKEAGGNRKAVQSHAAVEEAADGAKEMLHELIQTLEEAASASGFVTSLVDNLNQSISLTDEVVNGVNGEVSFVDFQTNISRLVKQLAKAAQDMMTKSVTNVQDLGPLANSLTKDYGALAAECKGAVASSSNAQVGGRIKLMVKQLGTSCINLVQVAGKLQCNPTDNFAKADVTNNAKKVIENITGVLLALQAGSRGTQACINAASHINGIIADLDTTIMFASAGTLNADAGETFADHREGILRTAKDLVAETKKIVNGAISSQEQLAGAAQESVGTITRLADFVKLGAASLSSEQPEAQVLLINAVKDVAAALSDLISQSKNAAGKSANDPAMTSLKDSAKVMVTNVTSLLKTVKAVEDDATRGTQALESSIEAIGQELKSFSSTDRVEKTVSADELVRLTKPITIATAKAVAAGNSGRQEDIIVAANVGRKAISDLLRAVKGGAAAVEDESLRLRVLQAGDVCGKAYWELLQSVFNVNKWSTPENKQHLVVTSKNVSAAVTELIQAAEAIKGTDWVDPSDPTVIAESELLSAANSIEAAAKKLASLQPRLRPKQANENLKFEEQILEACKSIAMAIGLLVKAASVAQRELVSQGKVGACKADEDDDSQWSQGLISAARLVVAATHSLCDAANAMVQGQASEEKLISSAKQVAASTAHLLVACKVKADPNSKAMNRLQAAGNAVKRATEALVSEAQKAKRAEDEASVTVDQRMVSGMAQVIAAQEEILKKEKELELARKKLEIIRKGKYKKESDTSGSEL